MESLYGDTEEASEDIPGRKKSKLKSLKTRIFGRSKRAGGEKNTKLSQSTSDIASRKGLGSEEDLVCPHRVMGSRAFSHDSIFLADQVLTDAEPARVLSQENVHSKIKVLQLKLQQQKMHLGPPPLVLPVRRPEDLESRFEDDGPPRSPPENSGGHVTSQGALSKAISQPFYHPLSPIPKPLPTKSVAQMSSHPLPTSVPSNTSVVEAPLDFSSPAHFTPCLDTSAARHRMSVKPKHQRACTKRRVTETHLETPNNIDHPESVIEEEPSTEKEVILETEQVGSIIPIPPEVASIAPKAAFKLSSLTLSQQDEALPESMSFVSPQLRIKPHRAADVTSSGRPHSSYIPSDLKDKKGGVFEMSNDKRNILNKAGMIEASSDQLSTAYCSVVAFRSSSGHQEAQGETESTRGIRRPAPGSGSFHSSITTAKNQDGKRPRSGSFVGVLEQTEAKLKVEDKSFSSMREKADLQPRERPFAMGRQAPQKSLVVPWDMTESLKKVDSVTPSENVTTDTGVVEAEEMESSQETVELAEEAQEVEEDEGKTTFGVKLRSTSQSMKFRSDVSSNQNSKPAVCEEQCDKQKRLKTSDNAMCKKRSTSITCPPSTSGDSHLTDSFPSSFSLPAKNNLPSTCDPLTMPTELQTTSSNPKEVETAPAAPQEPHSPAPSAQPEVSWMSLAMEKTRSLQQLFTSRFPRDFTGVQAAARPQTQVQTPTGAQTQTQTAKTQQAPLEAAHQPSTDAVKAEMAQIRIHAQTVKPSLLAAQQKTSAVSTIQSNTSREPQPSKQTSEPQSQPNTTASQSVSAQTNPQTNKSPLHTPAQTETSSQFAQESVTQSVAQSYLTSGQQQPPWSNRGHQPVNQLKPTASVSTTSAATAPPPGSALGRREREATVQEKDGAALSGRRVVWAGSVSEKTAFMEKRAEWTTLPGTKGVEEKKTQTEAQTSGEPTASAKTAPVSKDTKPEGRQGLKPAELSPTKVPDRPREEKWLRKNVHSSSPRSSSPTMASDSGQPSWMELAKRKSMAWSDKSMD